MVQWNYSLLGTRYRNLTVILLVRYRYLINYIYLEHNNCSNTDPPTRHGEWADDAPPSGHTRAVCAPCRLRLLGQAGATTTTATAAYARSRGCCNGRHRTAPHHNRCHRGICSPYWWTRQKSLAVQQIAGRTACCTAGCEWRRSLTTVSRGS